MTRAHLITLQTQTTPPPTIYQVHTMGFLQQMHPLAPASPRRVILNFAMLAAFVASLPAQTPLQFAELPRQELPAGGGANAVASGDVDGDGDLDLVCANDGYAGTRLYINSGIGGFTDVTAAQVPFVPSYDEAIALGDVDGDGDADLVTVGGFIGGENRLFTNDGNGGFADATAQLGPPLHDLTAAVAMADVDGDGDLDLVLGNYGSQDYLFRNDGAGVFTDVTALQLPIDMDLTTAVGLGDVDGDGDLDLIRGREAHATLYLNDGAGVFTDATATGMPAAGSRTGTVALADVDRDGDLDILGGGVLQNLRGQLQAPRLLEHGRPYRLDAYLRHVPAGNLGLAVVHLSTAAIAPVVTPFGVLGIDPAAAVGLPTVAVLPAAGVASVSFPVPNLPSIVGLSLYSQAILVVQPNEIRLSNVVRDVIL